MNNYKIKFYYSIGTNINDIFIKVLKKELKNYIKMICKNNKNALTSTSTYLLLHNKDDNI